jgi:hypothetical protein
MPAATRDHTWNVDEAAFDEGVAAVRNLLVSGVEISLSAANEGGIWKATADGSPAFQGLEFYGPSPKEAMDSAESFVRRLLTEE